MAAAYLIGINYINNSNLKLNGCWNDAMLISSYLCSIGMDSNNIDVVMDNTASGRNKTTKKEIINGLLNLCKRSWVEQLDLVVFSFSGHGSQKRDLSGEEIDGLDEGICPSDIYESGMIIDDDLINIFKQFNPKTKIFCIFDCCHSGTMLDLPFQYPSKSYESSLETLNVNITMISGCTDPECSADAFNYRTNSFGGALTMAFIKALSTLETKKIKDVHAETLRLLRSEGYPQYPLISSSQPINDDSVLF